MHRLTTAPEKINSSGTVLRVVRDSKGDVVGAFETREAAVLATTLNVFRIGASGPLRTGDVYAITVVGIGSDPITTMRYSGRRGGQSTWDIGVGQGFTISGTMLWIAMGEAREAIIAAASAASVAA